MLITKPWAACAPVRPLWLCAVIASFLGSGPSAPAQNPGLDRKIYEKTNEKGEIVSWLRKAGYRNVGVLKFRGQIEGQAANLATGSLNVSMAERLENALVCHLPTDEGYRVLHDAGDVIADRDARLTYLKREDRLRMFEFAYPVAWGREEVRADCFLTGLVRYAPGRPAEVAVYGFGRDGEVSEITAFEVPSGPQLRSEFGFSREPGPEKDATADFDKTASQSHGHGHAADTFAAKPTSLIELKVQYGNEGHTPEFDSASQKEYLPKPKVPGQRIVLLVKNRHTEPVGMVLLVNGLNTLDLEIKPDYQQYRMWILQPATQYAVEGYFSEKQKPRARVGFFETFSESDFAAMASRLPNPGKIELMVFVSKKPSQVAEDIKKKPDTGSAMKIALRGLSQSTALRDRRDLTHEELAMRLKRLSGLVPSLRGTARTIGAGKAEEDRVLEYADLPNPTRVEDRIIQFWPSRD